MPEEKNFFAGLFDFSFQSLLTRRIVKLLYVISILAGGVAVHPDKAPFRAIVPDFYQTNPVVRASAIMAECSALARTEALSAAE